MKKYDELTEIGKKRRMHKVACKALEQYDIDAKSVGYLDEGTNMFFKVVDHSGKKYAMKICQEESSKEEDNLAEIFLLEEVKKNSDILIPEIVYNNGGCGVSKVKYEDSDVDKRALLYEWVEGREIDGREDDGYFFGLGQIMAKLHSATENTDIPENIEPKKWDKVFYYRDEEPVYKQGRYQKFLDSKYHEVMDFIIPYMDTKLPEYYEGARPQLLHADLNPYNMWTYKKELRVIDFEEAMYALPVHDMAIALFYYKYDEKFDYEKVKQLVFEGYSSFKKLPDFSEYELELLIAARRVNFLNYVLLVDDEPKEYIQTSIARIQGFIEKYV
jgi:Ser/Thr protein kinase RdoA (MazF antagonist)